MSDGFSILILIGLIITISISIIAIVFIIKNLDKYGIKIIPLLNLISIIFIGIVFSSTFFLSTEIIFSTDINLILFYFTLIFETISLLAYCLAFSFLKRYGHFPVSIFLLFIISLSLLIGILISPKSIFMDYTGEAEIHFSLEYLPKILIVGINISGILYIIFKTYQILKISDYKNFCNKLTVYVIILSISIMLFCFYTIFSKRIFQILFILIFWTSFVMKCYMTIFHPKMFISLTNKIYFINIYHKTGVLLFSYQFEKSVPEEGDSAIWGNILIGLNHILSEFINKDDQINVLQTKNAEIIVNYNNEYGFAVLVITNQKNSLIEKNMEILTKQFEEKYKKELTEIQDINRIINVSDFKDAEKIIKESFELFL